MRLSKTDMNAVYYDHAKCKFTSPMLMLGLKLSVENSLLPTRQILFEFPSHLCLLTHVDCGAPKLP